MSNAGGSSWEGMNPDVVEAQARILGGLSEEITTLMHKIEGEVTQLADAWHGDDSRKFAAEWSGTHKPVFTTAATLLRSMSDTSQRNAGQQRATSSH
jgi:WXG100 family type VII secretion target